MSDEAPFLAAIHAAPHDPAPRLVYADWLEERGDPRAELLRVQSELVRTWSWVNQRPELAERLDELRTQFDPEWVAEVRSCTTPPPHVDFVETFPELLGYGCPAIRLHPRRGECPQDASKLSGLFLWPAEEAWPHCPEHAIPYSPVLQIRQNDVPGFRFPSGTDLLQLLWCGGWHQELNWSCDARIFWRRSSEVRNAIESYPLVDEIDESWDPNLVPCRLYPEPITDIPPLHSHLPNTLLEQILDSPTLENQLRAVGSRVPLDACLWDLVIEGTRLGGFAVNRGGGRAEDHPACDCGAAMELLFRIDSQEFLDAEDRNAVIEDRRRARIQAEVWRPNRNSFPDDIARPSAFGIHDRGAMHVFYCPEHPFRPVQVASTYN